MIIFEGLEFISIVFNGGDGGKIDFWGSCNVFIGGGEVVIVWVIYKVFFRLGEIVNVL